MNIKLFFKDGSVKDYPHEGRVGGSYTKSIKYEGQMAIITDEYHRTYAYPIDTL
jgi:hypothetical protein